MDTATAKMDELDNLDNNYWVKYYNITNVRQLQCNKSKPEDMYALSKICAHVELEECFHEDYHDPDDYYIQLGAAIWIILIMIIGIAGNMLTLTAIPYALWKKRSGIHHISSPIIIMVLHLAFTDLMVCFTNLPNYFIKHGGAVFHFKYAFDVVGCDVMWYLTFFSIYNGWLAQGVIAVIRALSMISEKADRIFRKKWIFWLIIPGMYIFSALMAIPFFKEPSLAFGHKCSLGHCHFVPTGEAATDLKSSRKSTLQGMYGLSMVMVLVSYTIILVYVVRSTRSLTRQTNVESVRKQLEQREMRMTWSILFVAITTVICQTCFIFMGASTTRSKDGAVHKDIKGQTIGRCINWTQYAINIFIYSLGSKEFRLAYLDFIKLPCDRRSRNGDEEESKNDELAMSRLDTDVNLDTGHQVSNGTTTNGAKH